MCVCEQNPCDYLMNKQLLIFEIEKYRIENN